MDMGAPRPSTPSARPEVTAALMAETGLDPDVLRDLVHRFYARVRADAVLGPIFAARITDWPPHLDRMVAFWCSVALMTGQYHGRPVPAHTPLPINAAHFDRWLAPFRATAADTCTPAGAAHVIESAERIAIHCRSPLCPRRATPPPHPGCTHDRRPIMTEGLAPTEAAALTRYIEARYHTRHREQLPMLAAMAERVEDVHFGDDGVPAGLSTLLRQMIGEMEVHMKKEELILFPAIRRGGMPGIENPIAVMRAYHAGHDCEVAEIRRLTGNLSLPEGACGTWTALYRGLAEFTADLTEHMRLENDVLFPQFEPAGRADA